MRDLNSAAKVPRRTGIRFHHKNALEMLKKAGAFISDGNLVKFPARVVKDALSCSFEMFVLTDELVARMDHLGPRYLIGRARQS